MQFLGSTCHMARTQKPDVARDAHVLDRQSDEKKQDDMIDRNK